MSTFWYIHGYYDFTLSCSTLNYCFNECGKKIACHSLIIHASRIRFDFSLLTIDDEMFGCEVFCVHFSVLINGTLLLNFICLNRWAKPIIRDIELQFYLGLLEPLLCV